MNGLFVRRLAVTVAVAGFALVAHAAEITGAGSTFVYPILSKWSSDYNQASGTKVNYQSIGSGGGIAQIKAATVDFGATDMPMSVGDLKAKEMGQFPSVIGGVVPVVNIDGVTPGQIRFTGPILADIYLGKIKKWSDPAIAKVNPGLKLPDTNITVVHRSDGSGTTFNWVNYLSKVSPEWKAKVGEGTSVAWPVGIGGKGNEGVAAYVNRLKNSVGYVEYAYVLQNKMTYGSIQNKAGNFVEPNAKSFQAAAATADWSKAQDFDLVMTDAAGPDAYPVTATTFIVMYKQPKNAAQSKATLDFFRWALEKGQPQAQSLDYVPLPEALVKQIESYWSTNFKF
ncbi:phosphate ABC transporter substrate-binding protein PstS [Burkholderia multivorans]|uniref:phosphate ABC transporter substrate-binding protein PstS n=1 Tax=Burkholderia multivorans TaxID=87883 RepID=UPI000CFF8732|nr:phosphate ABC transporter substrate-binding protein PstS [Burkholderia multivorans]AYY98906.1 phosphate ABC transporter substrate-binding protein PstS [Burkholderia multivorans]MBU9118602.1 phosphate ABC transporter substrate-binding protein PstS [Burkholderia multivorans]PRF46502.1 phosphate ABC transporter substrate-binding protein PstS [Burkholderia multivorans]